LAELKAIGILDEEIDEYGGEHGQAWKAWVLEDVAECGPNRGDRILWIKEPDVLTGKVPSRRGLHIRRRWRGEPQRRL
jgi:hypothetical protein